MKKLPMLILCAGFLGTGFLASCSESDLPSSEANSFRSDGNLRVLDVGLYIDDRATTEDGELVPEEIRKTSLNQRYSGDRFIGRWPAETPPIGYDPSVFLDNLSDVDDQRTYGYYLKVKSLHKTLCGYPTAVSISGATLTSCTSESTTVPVNLVGTSRPLSFCLMGYDYISEEIGENDRANSVYMVPVIMSSAKKEIKINLSWEPRNKTGSCSRKFNTSVTLTNLDPNFPTF